MIKFKINYTKIVKGLMIAVLTVAIAAVIMNALVLLNLAGFSNAVPALTITSEICSLFLLVAAVLLQFNSRYVFANNAIKVVFGISVIKLPYDFIYEIKEHSVTKELFLVYKNLSSKIPDNCAYMRIMIKSEDNDAFIKALREKNKEIIYNLFSPDK